jgi:hypothetical protein
MADSQPQPQAQQAAGGQPSQTMRPDDILRLQCLSEDERQKYRQIMMNFWNMTQQHAAGTSEHTTARTKLFEYSQKFIARERQYRKTKMQQQQGGQGQSSQGNQGAPQNQGQVKQEQPQVAPPQAQTQGQQQAPGQQQAQQQPQGAAPVRPAAPVAKNSQIDSAIIQHVTNFPIQLPLNGPALGTPEYDAKVKEYRGGYLNMLVKQAQFSENRRKLNLQINERQQKGLEVPADLVNMRQRVEKEHGQLGEQVEKFRKAQKQWKEDRERKQAQDGQVQPAPQEQPQIPTPSPHQQQPMHQPPPQQQPQQLQRQPSIPNMPAQTPVKEEPQIKIEGGQVPPPQPAAQFNMQGNPQQPPQGLQMPPSMQQQQQQHQQQQQQQQQQNQQQHQQQQARQPPAPHSQGMPPNQGQQFAQPGQQQQQQQQHMQQNRPQINPHQANAHQHQQSNSPHPQSATSNAPGAPVPLSHQAAVSAANRSYTDHPATARPGQLWQPGTRTA